MTNTSETVVFFGSGPVAAKSLELLGDNFTIEAVITKPRAPHHKGIVPVLDVADKLRMPVITASNKLELEDVLKNSNLKSKLGILIDFGIIISKSTIDHFSHGIINSHFSLLPKLRGADPITFAILNGDEKTGVSLMMIDEGMDTGKLITQKTFKLNSTITTPELTRELIFLSNQLLLDYIPKYLAGSIKPRSQPHPQRATYSRKLTKQDGVIDLNKSAIQIEREIRAFIGWPGSRTKLNNVDVIITQASANSFYLNQGDIKTNKDTHTILVGCGVGCLEVLRLKPVGKKEMSSREFISGYINNKK